MLLSAFLLLAMIAIVKMKSICFDSFFVMILKGFNVNACCQCYDNTGDENNDEEVNFSHVVVHCYNITQIKVIVKALT